MRRLVILLGVGVLLGGLAGAPPAHAATAVVRAELADPLMTDPVQVRITANDDSGLAVPFRGTVSLSVGRTSATTVVRAGAAGVALAEVRTRRLSSGDATLRVAVRAGGRIRRLVLPAFVTIPPSIGLDAFSCAAFPKGGGTVRWRVRSINGDPVRTPNSREVPLLPYVGSNAPRWRMTDEDGKPMPTRGSMAITSAGRTLAVVRLPRSVRRLVFGVRWNGRLRSGAGAGVYTAVLSLQDRIGRVSTASQQVQVGAGPSVCGS